MICATINFLSFNDIVAAAVIGAAASLLTSFLTGRAERKKLHTEITQHCIKNFMEIAGKGKIDRDFIPQYLAVINEELFYIEKKIIIKELANEWLMNIINFLPVFSTDSGTNKPDFSKPVNQEILNIRLSPFSQSSEWNAIISYPRILNLLIISEPATHFTISDNLQEEYDRLVDIMDQKKLILKSMKKNIKKARGLFSGKPQSHKTRLPVLKKFGSNVFL
jgi:hypothetical protein